MASVFAENDMIKPWCKIVLIIVLTTIFLMIAKFASQYIAVAWGKEDRILTDEEIEKYNIPMEATKEEVSELFCKS